MWALPTWHSFTAASSCSSATDMRATVVLLSIFQGASLGTVPIARFPLIQILSVVYIKESEQHVSAHPVVQMVPLAQSMKLARHSFAFLALALDSSFIYLRLLALNTMFSPPSPKAPSLGEEWMLERTR
jgi:hypothetical protein